ncbi:efflux RND transporter periplasmic adaptor subunit [Moritella sp. 24]|uniref:efflux RND transporter periplasmic adaptor subunit n=1 Tax=Moritella sp. 24 TaxID=2746230 RepID=UPI001BA4D31B|nr:efflux RND transporter periplasmic adaptor subunit [Moritella sp. 24]QUM77683.1 efflux RND transporter periplasmic adaptor subunit [Moritella sp. 24]
MNNFTALAIVKKPIFQASVIAAVFMLWMASGIGDPAEQESGSVANNTNAVIDKPIPQVRTEQFDAQLIARSISLYGRTAADRETNLGAEMAGRVEEVLAKRGSFVNKGDIIVKMEQNDLPQLLARAKTLYKQREIEYQGAKKLAAQGFQGKARLAEAATALSDASTSVFTITLQLEKTVIIAPISGILNERHVEVGDYLAKGNPIATIADINPLIVKADVTELDVNNVRLKQVAQVRLVSGQVVEGKVRYISRVANSATNTFRIEVAIKNPDLLLSAGGSAELSLPLNQEWAVKLSPSTLALDEEGVIGVKTVVDEHVVFTPVDILKADAQGSWLTGLGKQPVVITVGQGFVRAGDKVDAVSTRVQ